jgi:hypothetical protein
MDRPTTVGVGATTNVGRSTAGTPSAGVDGWLERQRDRQGVVFDCVTSPFSVCPCRF